MTITYGTDVMIIGGIAENKTSGQRIIINKEVYTEQKFTKPVILLW